MIRIAPVRKQLVVKASQSRAFAVFTGEMSRWWPATHSILKSPLKESIVEPRVGGRWYAVGEDGSTCQTGYVIAWQPPHSVVLAWQISPDWQYDAELVTEVEVCRGFAPRLGRYSRRVQDFSGKQIKEVGTHAQQDSRDCRRSRCIRTGSGRTRDGRSGQRHRKWI
jgi:uncharacterized protein YndB with AHSA1/START domain